MLHSNTSTHIKHMTMDDQICFHIYTAFASPVKPCRCITRPVEPMNGINKDMCGAELLPTTVSAYPEGCVCFCDLLKSQHCCLSSNARYNPPPATHPSPLPILYMCHS